MTIENRKYDLMGTTILLLAHSVLAAPASDIHTPKPGSKERWAILDALRRPVAKFNNHKRVIFTGVDLKVSKGWAYVDAASVDEKGKRVGPEFTNGLSALLRNSRGKWVVLEWSYATDVISIEWEGKHPQVPKRLWPHKR